MTSPSDPVKQVYIWRNPFCARKNVRPFAEIGEFPLAFLLRLQSFLIGNGVAFTLLCLTVAGGRSDEQRRPLRQLR